MAKGARPSNRVAKLLFKHTGDKFFEEFIVLSTRTRRGKNAPEEVEEAPTPEATPATEEAPAETKEEAPAAEETKVEEVKEEAASAKEEQAEEAAE